MEVQVGKFGIISLKPGFYVYVGSAFGPGGLKARIGRHLKKQKKLKWHIDFLRQFLEIVDICCSEENTKLECVWAAKFATMGGEIPLKRFGASDCRCAAHLWYFNQLPELSWFKK